MSIRSPSHEDNVLLLGGIKHALAPPSVTPLTLSGFLTNGAPGGKTRSSNEGDASAPIASV